MILSILYKKYILRVGAMLEEEKATINTDERSKRLKLLINMTGLSNKEFSEKNDISVSTLNTWVYGLTRGGITEKAAKRIIAAALKCGVYSTTAWLLDGIGSQPQLVDIPYATGSAHKSQLPFMPEDAFNHEVSFFCETYPNAITLLIHDDAMEPAYYGGDYVGGLLLTDNEILKAIGKDCIIKTNENQVICRRLTSGNQKGRYNLHMINPSSNAQLPALYDAIILSAAPVIRVWRKHTID